MEVTIVFSMENELCSSSECIYYISGHFMHKRRIILQHYLHFIRNIRANTIHLSDNGFASVRKRDGSLEKPFVPFIM